MKTPLSVKMKLTDYLKKLLNSGMKYMKFERILNTRRLNIESHFKNTNREILSWRSASR